jgi:hypothetical protein
MCLSHQKAVHQGRQHVQNHQFCEVSLLYPWLAGKSEAGKHKNRITAKRMRIPIKRHHIPLNETKISRNVDI